MWKLTRHNVVIASAVLALIVLLYLICRNPGPETIPSYGAEIEFFEMGDRG